MHIWLLHPEYLNIFKKKEEKDENHFDLLLDNKDLQKNFSKN